MDDPDDLAQRFLALWGEYLTALAGEPQTLDMLRRWLAAGGASPRAGEPAAAGPPPGTAAAAGASGERDAAMAELALRVGELERRLAVLEPAKPRRRPASGTRGRRRAAAARKP